MNNKEFDLINGFSVIFKVYSDDSFEIVSVNEIMEEAPTTDQLLDTYNDYLLLHNMFGDQYYMTVAEEVMNQLRGV